MDETTHPVEKLSEEQETALASFRQFTVAHPHLLEARTRLLNVIEEPANTGLMIIYGPSGVGKTTLLESIRIAVIRNALDMMAKDPGYVPIALVEATAPDRGNFDWKDFYIRALSVLEEPLVEFKIDPSEVFGKPTQRRAPETSALRRSLEHALRYRKTSTLLVDEAQHISKVASARKMLDQLDALKSLSNMSRTLLVLAGTYELLPFTTLSGQLSRRSVLIHMRRYRADVATERNAFKRVLLSFQERLPVPVQAGLVVRWEYAYEHSLGCVGVLKNWLTRALRHALENRLTTLTDEVLERHALSPAQRLKLAREIHESEKLSEAMDVEAEKSLPELLGLTRCDPIPSPLAQNSDKANPRQARKRMPGRRKASRDATGIPAELAKANEGS